MRSIELLAPAGDADIAIEAVKHGADAVYIGPPSHGARVGASNSFEDIKRAVNFAHTFGARVYVTVNTLVYDREISAVEAMIRRLYTIGVDALIVQDMGILRMDIPPIALHASTQCDIRTPEKARFLQEAGFSQLVLARELSVAEIAAICREVTVPVEVFVHGALCVSYSGRCSMGFVCSGRSGNRGECPQICRHAFTLKDVAGRIIAKDKYLLSLKDFRADAHLQQLIEAGVSSFKIEGRLKQADYVKNVTAYYSERLNEITRVSGGALRRSSYGEVSLSFNPTLERSFNRGFTSYRLSGKADRHGIASIHTPKSLGEPISSLDRLQPGDGISFFDHEGNYTGVQVNGVRNGKIVSNRPFQLPKGTSIFRTSSIEWKKKMAAETASRHIPLDITLDATGITAELATDFYDAKGQTERRFVRLAHGLPQQVANKPADYGKVFDKLGNTPFRLNSFTNLAPELFFPLSALTALRRELVEKLLSEIRITYRYDYRRTEHENYPYPSSRLDYRDNVANKLARQFYSSHGVAEIEPALETRKYEKEPCRHKAKTTYATGASSGQTVMSSRYCILRELGLCLKSNPDIRLPLTLESGAIRFTPSFSCDKCEMHLHLPD